MADAIVNSPVGFGLPLELVRKAIGGISAKWLAPHGILITHCLSPNFVEIMQPLPEICLVAEITGEPDYFDLIGAEEAMANELGLGVLIVPRRAVGNDLRSTFEANLVPL